MFFSKHPWHPWNDDRLFTAAKKSWSSQYCRLLLRWHHDIDSQQSQSVCSSQPNVYSGEIARSCSKTCRNIWYAYDYVRYFHITSYNISQAYFAWWYFPMKWMNVPYFPHQRWWTTMDCPSAQAAAPEKSLPSALRRWSGPKKRHLGRVIQLQNATYMFA